jgi:Na+/melibiose symporter-like transporter
MAIITTVCTVPVMFSFKNKPPTPPSYAGEAEKLHFKESLYKMFTNKDFILLCIGFSMVLGGFTYLATILEIMAKPYGFSSDDSSYMGILLNYLIKILIL